MITCGGIYSADLQGPLDLLWPQQSNVFMSQKETIDKTHSAVDFTAILYTTLQTYHGGLDITTSCEKADDAQNSLKFNFKHLVGYTWIIKGVNTCKN